MELLSQLWIPRVMTILPRLKHPLAWFVLTELIYISAVRLLVFNFRNFGSYSISMELYWTALRVVSIIALVLLFKPFIWRKSEAFRFPVIVFPVALAMLLTSFLELHPILPPPFKYLFAATSVFVGYREEIAYRGVLQGLLTDKFGFLVALLLSNIAFLFYHLGVQPFNPWHILMIFGWGVSLGLMYRITGSIVLIALIHAAVDAVNALNPIAVTPATAWIGMILLAGSITLLATKGLKGMPRNTS